MTKKKTTGGSRTVIKLKQRQALREEKRRQPVVHAMVWYKEEDYDKLLCLFDDRDQLPPTYIDWLVRAEEKKDEVESAGDQVVKVFIDPATFPEWCEIRHFSRDANARSELALEVIRLQNFRI